MTYFYVLTKIRAPWETYGTSIKCVSLVCRFIFPSVSGCPFTRRHHYAMTPWRASCSRWNKTSRKPTLQPSPVLKPKLWPRGPESGVLILIGKGRQNPTTQELNFEYMTYFYVPTKIRAPWETYGTSIKCVLLVCRFIFPSVSGCPFTHRHHSAMKPHVTHQTH